MITIQTHFFAFTDNHTWGVSNGHQQLFYWSSGNDIKEFRQWKWGCGDNAEDIGWRGEGGGGGGGGGGIEPRPSDGNATGTPATQELGSNSTDLDQGSSKKKRSSPHGHPAAGPEPDNRMGYENCIVYTDKNAEKGFEGEDRSCNERGSIVCDTFPRCSTQEPNSTSNSTDSNKKSKHIYYDINL